MSPPFLEFFARTNLVVGSWESLGWTQAEAGVTNLSVIVGLDRLPGNVRSSAAFFSVVASDGLVDDWADDDGDGVLNAAEREQGTNPRRADTDGDGYTDGEELAHVETGRELPEFDLSDDYTLEFRPQPANVFLDDQQDLFGVHSWDSGTFLAPGKVAYVNVLTPPVIFAPEVIGVNGDDDDGNGRADWEDERSGAGEDDLTS